MTFSMTFQSFPGPKFDHFHRNFPKKYLDFRLIVLFRKKNCLDYSFYTSNVIFHDFLWPTPKFHPFLSLENEIIEFYDFPWLVRTIAHLQKVKAWGEGGRTFN